MPIHVVSEMNQKEHWAVAHKRHKKQKEGVKLYLTANAIPRMFPVKVTMIRVGKRRLDSDNLQAAFKYVRDAIADYFIPGLQAGRADDDLGFYWCYDQIKGEPSIVIQLDWDSHELPLGAFDQVSRLRLDI